MLLEALMFPAGDHNIEFKFEPDVVHQGSTITLASSVIFGLLLLGGIWLGIKKKA